MFDQAFLKVKVKIDEGKRWQQEKAFLTYDFFVTKAVRKEKANHTFIQWVALLVRWGSNCTPIMLDWGSRLFQSERTIEGQLHGRSLLLYVRKDRGNTAKALHNALQQDAGVCVCRTKLWETHSTKAKHCPVRPVRPYPALKRNWLCKRTQLDGLLLASNRVNKWDELLAEDAIKRERAWPPSTA